MFKWLFLVLAISLSLAAYEIYKGPYMGYGVAIVLIPGLTAIGWMVAYFLLPHNHDNDSESATQD